MLLLLLSLLSYDIIHCTKVIKEKFNESSLMNQYHHNYLQVQALIKDLKHQFHEDKPVKREGDDKNQTKRERAFHDQLEDAPMMDQLGLETLPTKLFPLIRSRPSFPVSITPYTTELNSRHLKWDEIFPDPTVSSSDRTKSNVFRLGIRPLVSESLTSSKPSKTLLRSLPIYSTSITTYTTETNSSHLKWNDIFPDATDSSSDLSKSKVFRLGIRPLVSESPTSSQPSKTLIRSRPVYRTSITPYTTETNSSHLKWNDIFPDATVSSSDRTKSKVFRLGIRPLVSESPTSSQPSKTLIRSRPVYRTSITPYTTETNSSHLKWNDIFPDATVSSSDRTKSKVFRLGIRPLVSESPTSSQPSKTLIRSRPVYRTSITPYTTETNRSHLNWNDIFPDATVSSSDRTKSKVFRLGVRPLVPESPTSSQPSKSLIRYRPTYKTLTTRLNRQNLKWYKMFFDPTVKTKPNKFRPPYRPLKPEFQSRKPQHLKIPIISQKIIVYSLTPLSSSSPSRPNFFLWNKPLVSFAIKPRLSTTLGPSTNEVMKYWLQEITTYTPIEDWMKTLNTETVITPSDDNTTQPTPPIARLRSKTQTSNRKEKLQSCSRGQNPYNKTQVLISLLGKPIVPDGKKTIARFIEGKGGIHLRTDLERNKDVKTVVVGERPDDVNILVTPSTAGDGLQKEQDPDNQRESSNQIKKNHSEARKRTTQHYQSYKRKRDRQIYQHAEYSSEDNWSKDKVEEYPTMEGMEETKEDLSSSLVTHSTENGHQRQRLYSSNEILQTYRVESEDERRIKHIERRLSHLSQHKRAEKRAKKKDKTFLYKQVKKRLKAAESQKKVNKLKLKADLLRKIVEASSYSDEEASLKKNLNHALKHGNRQ